MRDPPNQVPDLRWHHRATAPPTLPAPVESPPSPMPGNDGLGLDNYQRSLPIRPEAGESDPKYAVSVLKARGFPISLKHIELMTKGEVLLWGIGETWASSFERVMSSCQCPSCAVNIKAIQGCVRGRICGIALGQKGLFAASALGKMPFLRHRPLGKDPKSGIKTASGQRNGRQTAGERARSSWPKALTCR